MAPLPRDTIAEMIKAPAEVFESPAAVLLDGRLDDAQRREILEAWAQDCRELAVADDEGMALGKPGATRLKEVEDALLELDPPRERAAL
ncbi:MAG: hypothetical protein RLW61_16120 [Gammaproteobacteria bacterium]